MSSLGTSLKSNKALRSLDLGDNLLSDAGVTQLAAALTVNTGLTYLSIAGGSASAAARGHVCPGRAHLCGLV